MNVKIYYGLSGTLKGSTIRAVQENDPGILIMGSSIKSWKYYEQGIFNNLIEYNDLNYGILHLVRLQDFIELCHKSDKKLLIERGVTDSLFYHYYNTEGNKEKEDEAFIKQVAQAEKTILLPDFTKIEKILLIQKDKEFVKNVVLQDEYRKKTFKNSPDYYFDLQSKYVEFTKKYNNIDQIITIDNAKDYVTNILCENWKLSKV